MSHRADAFTERYFHGSLDAGCTSISTCFALSEGTVVKMRVKQSRKSHKSIRLHLIGPDVLYEFAGYEFAGALPVLTYDRMAGALYADFVAEVGCCRTQEHLRNAGGPNRSDVRERSRTKRLRRNVLAIALANKFARFAWNVLPYGR